MALPKILHPLIDVVIPSTKVKVKFRPMLVKEEKILLIAKQSAETSDIFNAIYQIVNNCMTDKKMSVDKMTIFDLEYCYLKIRSFSVNNIAHQKYKDLEDEKEYNFDVDLDTIEVKFPENINKTIPVNDKVSVLMKYPPASLYNDKDFLADKENMDTSILIRCIDKIMEGEKMFDIKDAEKGQYDEFIENLPIPVFNKMKEFVNNLPGLYHKITYTNGAGNERVIELTSVIDFFIF